jgi:hypothetical protein
VPPNLGDVTQISIGEKHSCAVNDQGEIKCWGASYEGQRNIPADLGRVSQVSTGATFTCALMDLGNVRCWGDRALDQTNVPSDLGTVIQIDTAQRHSCALNDQGVVKCWGSGFGGATQVPSSLGKVTQITVGNANACALNEENRVTCWGSNEIGQTQVPSELGNVIQISAGYDHTCALNDLGSLRCWGSNDYGQSSIRKSVEVLEPKFINSPIPGISGTGRVGATLKALTGSWDNGTTFTYQWLKDGKRIPASTSSTYSAGFGDFGSDISVLVTALKHPLAPISKLSSAVKISNLGVGAPCGSGTKTMSVTKVSSAESPKIIGKPVFGVTLGSTPGKWSPGTSLCMFWLTGSTPIAKASGPKYSIQGRDVSQELRFAVVGSNKGSYALRISNPVVIGKAKFAKSVSPVITGQHKVGEKLTGTVKPWEPAVKYEYYWLRDGNTVSRSQTYTPQASDVGSKFILRVCGLKSNYETLCLSSKVTKSIQQNQLSKVGSVSISGGSAKVGAVLSGKTTAWMMGAKLNFQWLLDGQPISGANSKEIVVQPEYKGARLSFQVTGALEGFQTVTKTSAPLIIK